MGETLTSFKCKRANFDYLFRNKIFGLTLKNKILFVSYRSLILYPVEGILGNLNAVSIT